MAVNRTVAGPREHWPDHLAANPGSFTTVAANTFDTWEYQSGHVQISPARVAAGQTLGHDTVAYSGAGPIEESWQQRYRSNLSPAKVTAAATGALHEGQLT
jgi:hypothetical protein